MDLKLEGKTALVSGSTAGIGLAIARALAQEGATVTVNGRSEVRVRTAIVFISSIDALQIRADSSHYDMTKTAQLAIARGLAETTARTGVTVNSVLPGPTRSEAGV